MRIATHRSSAGPVTALIVGDEAIDISAALGVPAVDPWKFLATGGEGRELAAKAFRNSRERLPVASLKLLSPVIPGDKILGVGMNYQSLVDIVKRKKLPLPTEILWFSRPRGCLAGAYDDVWLPRGATDFDYEVELAVVIGKRCRRVTPSQAAGAIAGYTVGNDFTLRNRVIPSAVLGKSFDTHTPLGPWLVTPDELSDPHDLPLRTWVNGVLRQQSSTSEMIVSCFELISRISVFCTLNPGDVILTGTPSGSGVFMEPPCSLAVGDVIRVEIEGIGAMENRVIDEPDEP